MNAALLLAKQIVIMFILMGVGIVLYKKKMISDQGSKELGTLLLYLVIPAVVIKNFCIERTPEKIMELTQSMVFCAVSMLVALVISYLFFGKKRGLSAFSSAFSNAGFIGIPLVTGTVGSHAVFYISMLIVLVNLLQWTIGVWMITGDKSSMSVKKIVTNPIVISVAIGLVIFFLQIPVPELGMSCLSTITSMNTPIAMLVSGIYLAQADIPTMIRRADTYTVSVFRLVIIPVATIFAFKLLPFGTFDMKMAILIAAAAPVGSNVAVFARLYNKDTTLAIEHVCMSTVLCLISLPLLIILASAVIA